MSLERIQIVISHMSNDDWLFMLLLVVLAFAAGSGEKRN